MIAARHTAGRAPLTLWRSINLFAVLLDSCVSAAADNAHGEPTENEKAGLALLSRMQFEIVTPIMKAFLKISGVSSLVLFSNLLPVYAANERCVSSPIQINIPPKLRSFVKVFCDAKGCNLTTYSGFSFFIPYGEKYCSSISNGKPSIYWKDARTNNLFEVSIQRFPCGADADIPALKENILPIGNRQCLVVSELQRRVSSSEFHSLGLFR